MSPNIIPLGDSEIQKGMLFIQRAAKSGGIKVTNHAFDRMSEHLIDMDDVITCLTEGVFIEYQEGYKGEDPRLVIYYSEQEFYCVVALDIPACVIITVVSVDWTKWEREGKIIKRKSPGVT